MKRIYNSWIVLILKPGEVPAAMRIRLQNLDGSPAPEEKAKERAELLEQLREQGRKYAATLRWPNATIEVLGPMTELMSQVLYDAIPGDRITDKQLDELVARMGPGATNARRMGEA